MSAAVMTACTPGRLQRRRRIDRADAAVRDRAAQDRGVQRVRARHVVDELAAAAQEAQVLQPLDRAADGAIADAICDAMLVSPSCPITRVALAR